MITYRLKDSTNKHFNYTLKDIEELIDMLADEQEKLFDWCSAQKRNIHEPTNCRACKYGRICQDVNQSLVYLTKQLESGDFK